MKRLLNNNIANQLLYLGLTLILTLVIPNTHAQSPAFLHLLQGSNKASPTISERVNEKISKNFNRHFKETTNVKWYGQGKYHLVKFNKNDLRYQALFNKRGSLLYTIKYGIEKHLPSFIKTKIKFNYRDYAINYVIQVNEANREIWIVLVENEQNIATLRVEDNQLKEVNKSRKS